MSKGISCLKQTTSTSRTITCSVTIVWSEGNLYTRKYPPCTLAAKVQQAYCSEHVAILVTLLGPIPRRFQTGVGLLVTSCYKVQIFLCSLPLTKQEESPSCNLKLYFTILSDKRPYNHLQSQTWNSMWHVWRGIAWNGIHGTVQCCTVHASHLL